MGAILIRQEEAPRFEVHGATVIGYASPKRGSSRLAIWRVTLAAGASSPQHSLDADEIFTCLSGAADFFVDGGVVRVAAGDALTIVAGTEFRFSVVGSEPFSAMACVPSGCRARVEGGEAFEPPWAV